MISLCYIKIAYFKESTTYKLSEDIKSNSFEINKTSGIIKTTKECNFDREKIDVYSLNVEANSGG